LTEDEKRYSTMVEYPRGDPENPLSWDEMKERFHELAGQIIKKDQRLKIVEAVEKLDGVKDMRRWSWQLLRKE
jgi:2-methylcitrate dehydratase PrpD